MFSRVRGPAAARFPKIGSVRRLHEVPTLRNQDKFASHGIEGLYSPEGYSMAWTEYQKYLTTSLTLRTTGTKFENKTAFQTLLSAAKRTTDQHIFHYASQAYNNHFFFEQLTDRSQAELTRPSRFLFERFTGISTVEALKDEVIALANSMNGQGWIFVVEHTDKTFKLMNCNNDGTPFYYGKNQSLDLNGPIDDASFNTLNELKERANDNELDFVLPILAINCWDVAFYSDYGTTGRTKFLERVFDCIDWEVINKRMFQV